MFYKEYFGSIYFDSENELFYGKIEFIRDLVNYEATEAKGLIRSFHQAVDDYLEECLELDVIPGKPFKGNFNVRVDPELHREASLYALQHGDSLNNIIKKALNEFLASNHST